MRHRGRAPRRSMRKVRSLIGRIGIFVLSLPGLDAQDTKQLVDNRLRPKLKSLVMACHQSMGVVQTRRRHRRHIAGLSWACAPAKSTDGPVAHAISLLSIAAIVVPSKAKFSQMQQASESRWPIFPIGSKFKAMPVPASLLKNGKNRKHSRCSPSPRSERFPCRLSLGSEQPPSC